jgi:hypothetical protein
MRFLFILLFPILLFAEPIPIYFTITPTTKGKLLSVVKAQIEELKKNHSLKLINFDELKGKYINTTVIVAGEEIEGDINIKAKRLILDFCNSCFHLSSFASESEEVVCSNTPLLWFGYGKIYSLKNFEFEALKKAIIETYKPYAKKIAVWFGYIEIEFRKEKKTQVLRIK